METVEDRFLNGRLTLRQPREGYRAATDPVLLAAATPVKPGAAVLDLGCGVATAALCLAARVGNLDLAGLELQPEYAALARVNAQLNGIEMIVHQGDVRNIVRELRQRMFDAVMLNPPWHPDHDVGSPIPSKDIANRMDADLTVWLSAAMTRARPGGWIVIIQRIERLPDILRELAPRAGDISVLPLSARIGRPAKRVIVKARKGSRGPFQLAAPLVLHDGASHHKDGDDFSDAATAILRHGAGLEF